MDAPVDSWLDQCVISFICIRVTNTCIRVDEDQDKARSAWLHVVNSQDGASAEFRFKNGRYAKGQFEPLISETGCESA